MRNFSVLFMLLLVSCAVSYEVWATREGLKVELLDKEGIASSERGRLVPKCVVNLFTLPTEEGEDGSVEEISNAKALLGVVKYTSPYLLSKAAIAANGMFNGYLYGQLGPAALGSEAMMLTTEFLVMGTAMGGIRASSIFAGKLNGMRVEDKSRKLGNVNKTSQVLTTAYGAAIALPFFLKASNIIEGIGIVQDPDILDQIQAYFNGFSWGALPTLWLYGDEQFSLAVGDPHIALLYGVGYAALASVAAYPLALGEWGVPECGVQGIGYGMSIGAWGAWMALRAHYGLSPKYRAYALYDITTLNLKGLRAYISTASLLGLSNSIGLFGSFFYSEMVAGMGKGVAQAYSASSSFFEQWNIALLGESSSITALMANKDPDKYAADSENRKIAINNARRYAVASVAVAMGTTLFVSVPIMAWRQHSIRFFGGDLDDKTERLAEDYLPYGFGSGVVSSYSTALQANLHGVRDITVPFLIDTGAELATVGFASLAVYAIENPETAVAAGLIGTTFGAALYSWRSMKMVRHIKNNIINRAEEMAQNLWGKFSRWTGMDTPVEEAFA